MKRCPKCDRVYHDDDFYCLNDNYRLIDYPKEEAFKRQEELYKNKKSYRSYRNHLKESNSNNIYSQPTTNNSQYQPKCPTCSSPNIRKISGLSRAAHGYAFGLFSKTARSQFECKNCGYKW